jgi:hypothetical protein
LQKVISTDSFFIGKVKNDTRLSIFSFHFLLPARIFPPFLSLPRARKVFARCRIAVAAVSVSSMCSYPTGDAADL